MEETMEADSTQSDGDSAETSRKPANPLLRPGSMGTENIQDFQPFSMGENATRLSSGPIFPTFPYFFDLLLLFLENALLSLLFRS